MHWMSRIPRSERPPCRLSTNRQVAQTGHSNRTDAGPNLSGGRCTRQVQCVLEGHVRPDDECRIGVLAQDLPCFGGAQLAVDITLRSALGSSGEPRPRAADIDGAVLAQARIDKETKSWWRPRVVFSWWWQLRLAGGGARKPCSSWQKHAKPPVSWPTKSHSRGGAVGPAC